MIEEMLRVDDWSAGSRPVMTAPHHRPPAFEGTDAPRLRDDSPFQTPCLRKLDRQRWVAGLSFHSYGVRVGVRVNKPEALVHLVNTFPPGWVETTDPDVDVLLSFILGGARPGSNVRQYHLAYIFHMRVARTLELPEAIRHFDRALNLGIAERSPSRIFVHAGVVGWHGRAIVIPGRSFTGKSSLVAALVRAGATYYSDEYAVLDAKGRVHPYSKPLSVRQEGDLPPRLVTAEELGGRAGTAPLPVGLVLDTKFRPGVKWRPRRLTPGQGLLSLLDNTIPARRRPKASLRALRAVTERVPTLKGSRGEADDVATGILDNFSKYSIIQFARRRNHDARPTEAGLAGRGNDGGVDRL